MTVSPLWEDWFDTYFYEGMEEMPPQTGKSALAAKLGARGQAAHAKGKDLDVVYDTSGRLPPGIEGGIAQLVDCKFDVIAPGKTGAGEYFFYAAGVVVSPTEFTDKNGNKHRIVGQRTSIMEVLYDTPSRSRKTVEDHYLWVLNELKKLGVDTSQTTVNDLEAIAAALKKSKPYFKFRTWAGSKQEIEDRGGKYWVGDKGPYASHDAAQKANPYAGKDPMTNEVWNGVCDAPDVEAGGGVEDQTQDAGEVKDAKADVDPTEVDGQDLGALVEKANKKDKAAQTRLKELAMERGHAEDVCDATDTWEELAALCSADPTGEGESGGDDSGSTEDGGGGTEWEPQKGECYFVKLKDPRTKRENKKGTECEVVSVNKAKKTVKMKRLDTKADVGDFSWDDLSGEA